MKQSFAKGGKYGHDHYVGYSGNKHLGTLGRPRAIGVKKGMVKGLANMGPWGWFFVTLFLWIVGFPAYLAMRGKYKKINEQRLV